jgi:transposase
MATRNRGLDFSGAQIKRFRDEYIEKLFSDQHLVFTAKRNIATVRFLDRIVIEIETEVASQIKLKKEFIKLLTTPGTGNILGLTIMLEVGDIGRFAKAGNYPSYCRCVESKRLSNGKKKGKNNQKNGHETR